MTYKEFKTRIEQEIRTILGEEREIKYQTVHKLNGISYEGLSISDGKQGALPIFPLETCYQEFSKGNICMDEICRMLANWNKDDTSKLDGFVCDILRGTDVRENIYMRVVNYEMNKEWLKDYPYTKKLDLAIIYYVEIVSEEHNFYIADINYELMKRMNLVEEELFNIALKNCQEKQPAVIKSMRDIFPKMLWEIADVLIEDEEPVSGSDCAMHVLSNTKGSLGAVCMFYDNVSEEFAEQMQDDIYLLPSSINEMILIPSKGLEPESLRNIVVDVNNTVLMEQEILGGNVYLYERGTKNLGLQMTNM